MIKRRDFIKQSAVGLSVAGLPFLHLNCAKVSKPPNFVIIFCDDMGYGDWDRAGHPTIHTPNLGQMADEGVVMTQFYSASPVCSPSRAALLTGRYPVRTGIAKVLFPHHDVGLPESEKTIAELLTCIIHKLEKLLKIYIKNHNLSFFLHQSVYGFWILFFRAVLGGFFC